MIIERGNKVKISLCVIVKNEEKNIATCINSVKSIVDEIVVIDTGSTDDTVKIVEQLGGTVYSFEWIGDFAAARNYALSKANGNWIIFLDADEYVGKESISVVKSIIQKADKLKKDAITVDLININQNTNRFQGSAQVTRIIRKNPLIGYKGKIHENVYRINGNIAKFNAMEYIKVFHTGYSDDIIEKKGKLERNLELLYKELESNPTSSNIHFYLAESFGLNRNLDKMLYHAKEAIRYQNGNLAGIYQRAYYHQLDSIIDLQLDARKIIDAYNRAVQFDPTYPDYEMLMGDYYSKQNKYRKSLSYFLRAIEKCENYEGEAQSLVATNPEEMFKMVAKLYYILEEYEECVKYLIYILNVFKEDQDSLIMLIELLKERVSIEETFSVITKIYDLRQEKDKLIVLRACVALKDLRVNVFLKELLEKQTQKCKPTYY